MYTAKEFILSKLNSADYDARAALAISDPEALQAMTNSDLTIVRNPYVAIGLVIMIFFIIIAIVKMPKPSEDNSLHFMHSVKRLLNRKRYTEGVIAQFFYVGAQILVWTFIIQYGESIGMSKAEAQGYNIVAMGLFVTNRFVATFLMKYFSPGKLLMVFGFIAVACTVGAIFLPGKVGLISLVGVSAGMSLMFPTIYGIALKGVGDDAKFGAAGLIMSIVGGSVLPPLQALVFDIGGPGYTDIQILGINEVRLSFIIPLICLIVVTRYGWRTEKVHDRVGAES
jgi:FHS family L-fucose permease-like MFS transporter